MEVVSVELRVPAVDDEAGRAAAAAPSFLAPLDAQLRAIDLELIESLKSTLAKETERTRPTVGEIVQDGLALGPDIDAGLGLITTLARVGHPDEPGLSDVDVHGDSLVHSQIITHPEIKVNP